MIAIASIATQETDGDIRYREQQKGCKARLEGWPRRACPWNGGLTEKWWLEGYDNAMLVSQVYPL